MENTPSAAPEAPKTETPKVAAPAKVAAKTAAKPAKSKATAIPERTSKVGPLMQKVVDTLTKGPSTVAAMAAKFEASEREIRQAIDRARAKKHEIKRLEKNTFGFAKK